MCAACVRHYRSRTPSAMVSTGMFEFAAGRCGPRPFGIVAGPAHDIGEDERQKRFEKAAADAIQHLNGQQPGRVVRPHAERAAQRNRGESEEQKRLAPEVIRPGDEQRHQNRGELGDDDCGGGETGFPARIGQSELLDDERQHRRVGEMEQRRGAREHEKCSVPDEDASESRPRALA